MFNTFEFQERNAQEILESLPEELPILPLRNVVALPYALLPLSVGVDRSVRLVEEALEGDRIIGMVASHDPELDRPMPGQLHEVGTIGVILKAVHVSEDSMQVMVQGVERFEIEEWTAEKPYLRARINVREDEDVEDDDVEIAGLRRKLLEIANEVITLTPNIPDEIGEFLENIDDPRYLAYVIASNSRIDMGTAQKLLETDSVKEKVHQLIVHLTREREILQVGQRIAEEAQEEMSRQQREYYLRQQLDAIRRELGESEDEDDVEVYRRKLDEAGLPEEAYKEAQRELKRLSSIPVQAPEYGVIKTYLDWLTDLPWSNLSEDNLDVEHARKVLDEDHYDLKDVKDRILEFLAVRKLGEEREDELPDSDELPGAPVVEGQGAILCFVGPPGVGKTSLGKSVARALGREFTRMSLGGMRDEAEIRGHRRTYIGAMPGRIIQALKRAGTRNPVFMLDEVDKIGSDWRGDPSSALLEVLDPQQNNTFRDHYLDVDYDLSDVMFITTANQTGPIPAPLLDRMELITIDGYTEHEKIKIAEGYLVPRQRRVNNLKKGEIHFGEDALRLMIREYTREAGVRNLERAIGQVCRKAAVKIASGERKRIRVTEKQVRDYLGKPKVFFEAAERAEIPGVATGLAWTPSGGDVLFVEATRMPGGKGNLTITGQLGKVMEESVRIAFSYARAKSKELGIDPTLFESSDFHLHVPEGAIPKDGPSAGVTMVTAMASLLTGRPARADVGMTGETTLRGQVLPVGGVKHKVLAAHRAGLKTIILPKRNEADLAELDKDVRDEMTFILVEQIDEVLKAALHPAEGEKKRGKKEKPEDRAVPLPQIDPSAGLHDSPPPAV